MTRKPVIAVVGNCQARPLAQALAALFPTGAEIATVAVVQLLDDADAPEYEPGLDAADWIFAQSVAETYPCSFVRTAVLGQRYAHKLRRWPNLFYHGYNPELVYLRGVQGRPLAGPLGDYHNATLLEAWRRGMSAEQALQMHLDDEYNDLAYRDVPERSLLELARREAGTDVRLTPWIRERRWEQRLFFTFNHPAAALIAETARQLVEATGAAPALPAARGRAPEPLGAYRPPVNPWVRRSQHCTLEDSRLYAGVEVLEAGGGQVRVGKRRLYEPREIADTFFSVYDRCADMLSANRVTVR